MIVTTCGAAGALSPPLPARAGGAGLFGDGAGVCAEPTPQQIAMLTKIAARIVLLTFICLGLTKLSLVQSDSRSASTVVNQS